MNAKEIKQRIVEGLGDRLGKYAVGSNSAPAVWIGGKVPSTYVASGLEVIISPTPSADVEPIFGNTAILREDFDVRFIEHKSGGSLHDVVRWMIAEFRITKQPVIFPETDDMFHQATFRVPQIVAMKQF